MQTYRIVVAPRALADLDEIHATIAKNNPLNAARFVGRIVAQIDGLATRPGRFAEAPEAKHFKKPLRHVTVWPYRIVYRVGADTVEVVTVRHGTRLPLKPRR